jgi:two-component system chemotaxis response regulator CheY
MRVLIADDSALMRKVLRGILEGMEIQPEDILETENGAGTTALLAISRQPVDLVIADWDLPGLEGAALLQALAATPASQGAEILACIHPQQRRLVSEALKQHKFGFIERPFTDSTLQGRIQALARSIDERKAQEGQRLLKNILTEVEACSDLPFLLRLPSEVMDAFLRRADRRDVPAGTIIVEGGKPVYYLHVITMGEVEVVQAGKTRLARDGDCVGEVAFVTGEPSVIVARARTPVQLVSLSRPRLTELIQRHPRMADYMAQLVRPKAGVTTGAPSTIKSEFTGTLQSMCFSDVIQLLQVTGKTGSFLLDGGNRKGGIYLEGGEVRDAWIGEETGEEVFYRLASWSNARFSFVAGAREGPATIQQPTMTLLMEAMRRMDESGRHTPTPVNDQVA